MLEVKRLSKLQRADRDVCIIDVTESSSSGLSHPRPYCFCDGPTAVDAESVHNTPETVCYGHVQSLHKLVNSHVIDV